MIYVQGYSGCGISVFPNPIPGSDGSYVLEKVSKDTKYIPRLLLQLRKQQEFNVFNKIPNVFAPTVLYKKVSSITQYVEKNAGAGGSSGGPSTVEVLQEASIGMKFELHVDALSYLERCGVEKFHRFGEMLTSVVDQYVQQSQMRIVPSKVFTGKLKEIQRNLMANQHILPRSRRDKMSNEVIPAMLQFADDHVSHVNDGNCTATSGAQEGQQVGFYLPFGACHGDLTLSNVLVKPATKKQSGSGSVDRPEEYILIDFLDSFVESPICDVAKLAQDLVYGWSLRMHTTQVDSLKIVSVFKALYEQHILAAFGKQPWFRNYFHFFLLMNQLRVLQYAVTDAAATYLCNTIDSEYELWLAERGGPPENEEPS